MSRPSRVRSLAILLPFLILGMFRPAVAGEVPSITLTWDPVDTGNGPDLVGYRIYSKKTGETHWKQIGEVSTAPFTYTFNFTHKKKYDFFVTAFDSKGQESDPSNVVSWPIQMFDLKEGDDQTYRAYPGSTYNIEWFSAPKAERFTLYYSTNRGASWVKIPGAENLSGKSFEWTVPTQSDNKNACLVRVIGFDSKGARAGAANSDVPFRIEIVKLQPINDGFPLVSGMPPIPVVWQTQATRNPVAKVNLYYKLSRESWKLIRSLDTNPGILTWQIPSGLAKITECRVRIILKDVKGKTVGTDEWGPFEIYP